MRPSLRIYSKELFKELFSFKKTNRLWHVPLLAALCVGVPLFVGLFTNQLASALIASMSGLVILYIPIHSGIVLRMRKLLFCSFGLIVSYAIGLLFSFDPYLSSIVAGVYALIVHWINLRLSTKPPGNFFFIMLAVIASCLPYDPESIPHKLNLVALGSLNACLLAFIYSLLVKRKQSKPEQITVKENTEVKNKASFLEAFILGFFIFASLLSGHLLKLENPYWIPISCLAVMQGVTLYHIWSRVFQRILGTFLGLLVCWLILSFFKSAWTICIAIVLLQFIVELLIVRHYALTVIFITPMTLLLAEAAKPAILDPNHLLQIRFMDIAIGSMFGAIGGWLIHNEKIRYHGLQQVEKARFIFKKLKS